MFLLYRMLYIKNVNITDQLAAFKNISKNQDSNWNKFDNFMDWCTLNISSMMNDKT